MRVSKTNDNNNNESNNNNKKETFSSLIYMVVLALFARIIHPTFPSSEGYPEGYRLTNINVYVSQNWQFKPLLYPCNHKAEVVTLPPSSPIALISSFTFR